MAADHICNFFFLLSNMVIYEKEDERAKGFKGMQKEFEKPFIAYQHLLILKSCIDLVKFNPQGVKALKKRYLDAIDPRVNLPPELILLNKLCH